MRLPRLGPLPLRLALQVVASRQINPTSPCFSGTIYPSYSAIMPTEFPNRTNPQPALMGDNGLNEDQAKSHIEAKEYSISGLQKHNRRVWRGKATVKDGRSVAVILDLEGNIYSEFNP